MPRWVGIAVLLAVATTFGANHIAARIAFEHGANVTTAVAFRSTGTALVLLFLLLYLGVSLRVPALTARRAILVGVLVAAQSYCLYSAVAIIPVALALLAFQTFPMMFALLSWATGGERPRPRALAAMPVALFGLSLALDVWGKGGSVHFAGIAWASAAALSFACAMFLMTRWLHGMDGRLRSFFAMSVVSVLALAGGGAAADFKLPGDTTGWIAIAALTVFYGVAITATFVLLPRLGAVNNAVVFNFEPIAVLALAWVILDQKVAPLQIVGAFIVVGAIAMLGTGKK
jgi:drug/metabolite transporter (DMT)-like permease